MLETVQAPAPDPLMDVLRLYAQDSRRWKMDLGIGTYRNAQGCTPVMGAVKKAERRLAETQSTKSYLSPAGDACFLRHIKSLVLPPEWASSWSVAGAQTPGGTGAFRLGCDLYRLGNPEGTAMVGMPSWPNHLPILHAAGIPSRTFVHHDSAKCALCFEESLEAISGANRGDLLVVQASCHNPTGHDYSEDQWKSVATLARERGVIPFIDIAYQGIGRGLTEDARSITILLGEVEEALIAISCSKSFGLYRDRTGALLAATREPGVASRLQARIESLARTSWSMPPDHGAAVVSIILDDRDLTLDWQRELDKMRTRINGIRSEISAAVASLPIEPAFDTERLGMFALLPLSREEVKWLRESSAIYLAENGRMNVAGLASGDVDRFAEALRELWGRRRPSARAS